MTYPVDQFLGLIQANGQLVLKLSEISRASGSECAELGGKAATEFLERVREMKPGTIPDFRESEATALLKDIEKRREDTITQVKAAFDEWQDAWKKAVTEMGGGQEQLAGTLQDMLQPWLNASGAAKPARPKTASAGRKKGTPT